MFTRKIEATKAVDWMDGVTKRLMIGPKDGAPTYLMRVYEIAPGATYQLHCHNWEHEGTPLAGEGAILTENGEYKIEPGIVYYIPPNEPHAVINKGKETLRVLCTAPLCAYNVMMDPD